VQNGRYWPSATNITLQDNVGCWGKNGSRFDLSPKIKNLVSTRKATRYQVRNGSDDHPHITPGAGFLGGVCFAAFLRAGLALALPRFELFVRVATPFRALAMVISYKILLLVKQSRNKPTHNSQRISSASGWLPSPRFARACRPTLNTDRASSFRASTIRSNSNTSMRRCPRS